MSQWTGYEQAYQRFNVALWRRIISHNHRGRRVEKLYNAAKKCSHRWMYAWEAALAFLFIGWATMRWSWDNLTNNTSLVYPLYQVSTLECRTEERWSMDESCKIKLPIIHNSDYVTYQNEKVYTDIYTTLWWASYAEEWNQSAWAHYGVDIATAKWTPLYAIADWEVYSAGYNSSYGNVVKIKFKLNWEILYAVYAHMNSISVKAWDVVTKWQQIWEVGNTGNTFWALGWYHVHFEIDKDNWWRPAYAFSGCPELSQWHSEIIANGYCRIQLFQYTKDPIALLESVKSPYPVSLIWTIEDELNTEENKVETNEEHGSAITWDNTEVVNSETTTWVNKIVLPEEKVIEEKPLAETENKKLIDLDYSQLDVNGKEFVNKWNLEIEKGFDDKVLLENSTQLIIHVTNKVSWEKYNGALNLPITAIASNTNVSLNPVSIMLVQNWEAVITVTPLKKWNTYIALNLWNAKIWGTTISVQ